MNQEKTSGPSPSEVTKGKSDQPFDLSKVEIKPFDPRLRRAAFSCGRTNMDNFLKKSAPDQHKKSSCRTYLAVSNDEIVGYYTLSAASRDPNILSEEAIKRFGVILSAPCVYLGMFATDSKFQRRGIGQKMMVHAMEITAKVSELVGVYALILDAADAEVAERYEKWGFEYFVEGKAEYKMYMPLGTIKSAIIGNATV